jgi:hypothetical protein
VVKKFNSVSVASASIALGLVFVPSVAYAAVDFTTANWSVGGVTYQFWESGGDAAGLEEMSSNTYPNFSYGYDETDWGGGDLSSFNDFATCSASTATATTESNGDVLITCAPFQMGSSDAWFSESYLFYNDQKLARHFFSLENRGSSVIQLNPSDNQNSAYFYFDRTGKNASSSDSTGCSLVANDNWVLSADTSDTTISGVAWQASGGTAFSTAGQNCVSDFRAYVTKSDLAIGETVNFMTFVKTFDPNGSTVSDMNTAFASAITAMSGFDSLTTTLCRGIEDLVVDGWGDCSEALTEDSSGGEPLAPTGGRVADVALSAAVGAVLLWAGVFGLTRIRRRI